MGPEIAAAAEAAASSAPAWLTPGVSAALMAGGTAAQMLAAKQQQRQQREILNRQFAKQEQSTRQGTGAVLQEGAQEGGAAQAAGMQAAAEANAARTMADLKGAGADLIDTAGDNGAQSQAFLTAKADRALQEGNRQSAIARELGKVRSVNNVQTDAGMRRAALAEQLGSVARTNQAGMQAAQLDAQAVDSPWYGDIGKIASLVGTAGMLLPAAPAGGVGELGTAKLGEVAAETPLGMAKFGDMATSGAARFGTPAAAAGRSALARALPALGMFTSQRAWAGR